MAKQKERASKHERVRRSRASDGDRIERMMNETTEDPNEPDDVDAMIEDWNRFAEFHANDDYQVIE